jgi:hypothetical protein
VFLIEARKRSKLKTPKQDKMLAIIAAIKRAATENLMVKIAGSFSNESNNFFKKDPFLNFID